MNLKSSLYPEFSKNSDKSTVFTSYVSLSFRCSKYIFLLISSVTKLMIRANLVFSMDSLYIYVYIFLMHNIAHTVSYNNGVTFHCHKI